MATINSEFFGDGKDKASIKDLLLKYLRCWPLFLASFAIFIAAAYFYIRYAIPKYTVATLMLVTEKDKDANTASNDLIKEALTGEKKDNEDNEMQIMSSRTLMDKVVLNNQLNISYYRIGKFRKTDIYLDAPFRLIPQRILDSNNTVSITVKKLSPLGAVISYGPPEIARQMAVKWNTPFTVYTNSFILTRHGNPLPGDDNFAAVWYSLKDASSGILQNFSVQLYDKKSSILYLALTTENLERGKDILNGIAQAFIQSDIEDKSTISQNAIRFIDDRLNAVYSELTGVEGSLENYQGNNDLINVTSQSTQSFENTNDISKMLTDNKIKQGVVNMIQAYFNDPTNKDKLVPSSLGIDDVTLANLIARYNNLQLDKERQTPLVTPNSMVMKDLNNQLQDIKGSILESLQNISKNLKLAEASLQQKNSQYSQFLSSLPHKERVMQEIKRKQSITEGLYLYLLQKREEAAISSSSSGISLYKQLDSAEGIGLATLSNSQIYSYAVILGFLLPIGLVRVRSILNDKIMRREDVTAKLQIPLIGELNHVPRKYKQVSMLDRSVIAEQFRAIRTNYTFWLRDKNKQTVLVTSTGSGEGKSFVSLNLASVLAIPGKKVALLEFDLRKPGLTKKLNFGDAVGLSDYITGNVKEIGDMTKHLDDIPTLDIYLCGTITINPSDLLLSDNCTELFNELKKRYDYIVIDTPPVGFVSDAFALSSFSDAVIYIVQQRNTLKKQVEFIRDIFRTQKFSNMFLLINDIKGDKANGYGYGYGTKETGGGRRAFFKRSVKRSMQNAAL